MKRSKSKTKDKPSTEVIDYFPRGNTSSHQNDFTFNTGYVDNKKDKTNFLSKKRKTTSRKSGETQTQLHNENEGVHIEKAIENESSKVLLPKFKLGDLVLLSVCEIRKDYMIASYSRNKKAMIHSSYSGINVDNDNDNSDFDFGNYFHIGQFICGAVIRHGNDIRLDNGHVNKKILVTIDPKIVNTGLMPQHVVEGMDLYGQLLKNEEGKYMVDFRLGNDHENENEEENEEEEEENEDNKNTLKEDEVNYVVNLIDDNNDNTLFNNKRVGSYYYFKVVKTYYKHKKLNIDVSIDITKHKFPLKSLDFPHIRPGFLFKANITRELSNGKECAYGGNIGSIFIDHVHNETKTKNILVRVVHVATSKRKCGLSSLPHIKTLSIADIKTKRKLIGQTASNAKVTKLLYGNSLQVSIQLNSNEYFAFMHKNHIHPANSSSSNTTTDKETQINDTFPLVYVKEYNYFDDCPIVECISNDSNSSSNNMITWDTLHIGQSVQCTIKEVNSNNDIIVKLNSYIEGKIPLMHLTNTPLKKIPKSIVKGKELSARIFELNIKTKKLVLTAKECLNDNDVILHSTINEIKEGDDVNVIYIGKGIFIHSNNIKGRLIQFKSLNENELKIGNVYKYKVYKIDHEKEKVYYTMQKTTFSNSNRKGTPKQIGDVVSCVINGIKGNYIYCVFNKKKIGRIDINTFNGNVNQIKKLLEQTVQIRKQSADNNGDDSKNASVSALKVKAKVVNISISKKSDMKIYDLVVIDTDTTDTNDDNTSTIIHDNISTTLNTSGTVLNTGIIASVKQTSKHPLIITINSPDQTTLKLPFSELPLSNITENGITYKPGNKIQFYMNASHEIFLSPPQHDQTPIIGNIYPCRILKQIPGRGIILDLNFPSKPEIFVDICEITDYLHYNPLTYFNKNQITKCRIISRNDTNNIYNASLRASIINDDDYHTITQGSTLEFTQRYGTNSSFDLRNKIMKYGITNSIELNTLAIGYITSSSEKGVFIKLANNVIARASLHELSDDSIGISKQYLLYKENNICLCRVISLYKASDNADMKVNVSLRKSVIKYGMFVKKKDVALNNFYLCNVLAKGKKGYDVNIVGSTFVGVLKYKRIKKGSENAIEVGVNVILQVVKLDNEGALHKSKIRFSNENIGSDFNNELVVNNMKEDMIAKAKENEEVYDSIRDIIENAKKESEMNELIDMNDGVVKDNEIDFEELVEKEAKRRKLSVASSIQNDNEDNDVDMDDDDMDNDDNEDNELDDDNDIITDQQEKIGLLSGIGGINETSNKMDIDDNNKNDDNTIQDDNAIQDDNDNDDDDNDQPITKQQTASQREKTRLLTEMQIREKENAITTETQSAEYYEKLILSDRNNSLNWISYASYILSNLGANSARQIFKRAIKTIDIANLQDKSNIWIAYINLEHLYGTPETFRTTVEEALEVNEKKPIYTALIKIYLNSNNYKMANEIYLLSLKDYFNDVTLWKQYIKFLFNVNYSDKLLNNSNEYATCKDGLNRSLQVIGKKQHLDMMVYYSGLLYEYGSCEEARNMFDNIVKGVPKRIDIWMVYVDKEIKYGNNVSKVRQLFDRVFDKDLKEKQLRLVCKKYLEFESKNAKNEKEIELAKERVNAVIQDKMSKINNTMNDGVNDNNDNEE